jgi:hypothetical protein
MAQNISNTNAFTTNFEVGVPEQTDEANIVQAFTEYHYGPNYNGVGNPGGIEGHLQDLTDSIQNALTVEFNPQGTSYALVLGDKDKIVEINSASATTLTVPLNSTVAFPIGSSINILQTGAGQVTVAGAGGVTINATPGLKLRTQWSFATLIKRATNTWVLIGDTAA